MDYSYITNPTSGRKVNINGKIGKRVINNYIAIQNGGKLGNPCSSGGKNARKRCERNLSEKRRERRRRRLSNMTKEERAAERERINRLLNLQDEKAKEQRDLIW